MAPGLNDFTAFQYYDAVGHADCREAMAMSSTIRPLRGVLATLHTLSGGVPRKPAILAVFLKVVRSMSQALRRVRLNPHTDLLHILEEVRTDKVPRLIEREGEALAVVVDPEEYAELSLAPKSKRFKQDLLALAGVWSDLDADEMIEEVYRARHETPPSTPLER